MYIIVFTHSFWINTKWSLGQVWLPVITNHLSMLEKDHNFIIEPTVKSAEIYIWWQRKAKTLHFLWDESYTDSLNYSFVCWLSFGLIKKSSHGFLMSFFAVVLKIVKQHLFCFLQTAHLCISWFNYVLCTQQNVIACSSMAVLPLEGNPPHSISFYIRRRHVSWQSKTPRK